MRYGAKIFQGFATLEIKNNVCAYFMYILNLQHKDDKVHAKSTPSPWFIGLSKFSTFITSIHPEIRKPLI